ncbi:MAG TPA: HWE histidine kinase domain-containing protein [Rhizomicrobium sp.]|nr:HWE histidine kinase domain-containing protein [Rhizomicrobium sp.]
MAANVKFHATCAICAVFSRLFRGVRWILAHWTVLRVRALAHAHDLLTSRFWAGANLNDLVTGIFEAFSPMQVTMFGDPVVR